ncbi:MAG: oligoribonuclease [Patescibacteria group bacterium]
MDKNTNLVWIDIEGTGLDLNIALPLEIAVVITDRKLEVLDSVSFVIHQSQKSLSVLENWPKKHLTKNKLLTEVDKSKTTVKSTQTSILKLLEKYCLPQNSPLCGNSLFYDKYLLMKYLPKVFDFLHYRIIDISSLKELYFRLNKNPVKFAKSENHRALDDIHESITELKFYQSNFLKTL